MAECGSVAEELTFSPAHVGHVGWTGECVSMCGKGEQSSKQPHRRSEPMQES